MDFLIPTRWPLWARRTFLVTLPVSGPALLAVWIVVIWGIVTAIVTITILGIVAAHLLTPFIDGASWIVIRLLDLWSPAHDTEGGG